MRLRTTDTPVNNVTFYDELDELNGSPVFVPGSLALVAGTIPPGADTSGTDPTGGANGTGVVEIGNLSVPADSEVFVQFDITLAPVLTNGLVVTNQADLIGNTKLADSDDPNINGLSDPNVNGDEDPTEIAITSAPAFTVEKSSTYMTGDPNVLLAGETLRYTITVQNIGTDNATDVSIVDQVPANTTYVSGTTTLNGVGLADDAQGNTPLAAGIQVNAPQDSTPGVMNAGVANNVATISFDVVVDPATRTARFFRIRRF